MITKVNQTLEETLATIAKMAPELRRMRVPSVTVGDVSFTLELDAPEVKIDQKPAPKTPSPLSDPDTYGWADGVPGFRDPRSKS